MLRKGEHVPDRTTLRQGSPAPAEPAPAAPAPAPLGPAGVLGLQSSAGNQAVVALLRARPGRPGVHREPNASMPPPVSSQAPAADAEVMHFEGKALRYDRELLVRVLKSVEAASGIGGRASFINRFGSTGIR